MRTTITLPDNLAAAVKEFTGEVKLSDAVRKLIETEERRRAQFAALDLLRKTKLPHDMRKIKAARKGRRWSA